MCTAGRVRFSCTHLGRKLGYESCVWFKLADTSIKLGVSSDDAKVVLNERRCAQEAVTKYFDKERKCRACMRSDREKEGGKMESLGDEEEKEVWGRKREDW
jgi:hypothetical protein